MKITTRGRYALRTCIALARLEKEKGAVSIGVLAELENISFVFLEQIFFKLRKAGLVSSVRGPSGGFHFAKPLDQITVKEILEAAGEDMKIIFCNKRTENCEKIGECLCHHIWEEADNIINNYFSSITLASILEKNKKNPFMTL